jgi:hypothetical protein
MAQRLLAEQYGELNAVSAFIMQEFRFEDSSSFFCTYVLLFFS